MRTILLAALAAIAASSASAAERRYTVTDFDRIQVDGPFEVTLATGRPNSATVIGSTMAIERVSIEVTGRTLRIRANRSGWGGYPGDAAGGVKIVAGTLNLRSALLTGSGRITVDKVKAMRFDASVSGNGSLAVGMVEADQLVVGLLGSGRIAIGGKSKTLRATVQGSGDFDGSDLVVEDAELNADTSGMVTVGVNRAAKVRATGPGDTKIVGTPACTVNASGSGRVFCGKD